MAYGKNKKHITAERARRPLAGVPIDLELAKEAIIRNRGVISYAAEEIGCNRHSLHQLINRHECLQVALEDARERLIDLVEEKFIDKAIKGDSYNAAFVLKTRGRHRGYDVDMKETNDVLKQALSFVMNKSKNPADM
jgi:hypothetical protein